MTDCPFCRKAIDPLATRCPHCRSEVQLTPVQPAATTFYSAVIAPALGAGLMSFFFWMLSPFSGYALHFALGGATDLPLSGYMVGFDAFLGIALVAISLAALCGWLRYAIDSLLLSLLSFCTPFIAPPLLIIATQLATLSRSL